MPVGRFRLDYIERIDLSISLVLKSIPNICRKKGWYQN